MLLDVIVGQLDPIRQLDSRGHVGKVVVEGGGGEGVKGEEYRLGVKGRCLLRFPPCYQVLAADKLRMCHTSDDVSYP